MLNNIKKKMSELITIGRILQFLLWTQSKSQDMLS